MIFPYWEVQRGAGIRYLPLVPITAFGAAGEMDVLALIDSGAEHSVFGLDLAERLGVPLDDAQSVVIVGVGGQESAAFLTDISLKLGSYHWIGPAVFSAAISQRAILGQAGFFEYFTVVFRRNKLQIEIRKARQGP